MEFRALSADRDFQLWRKLFRQSKLGYGAFLGFEDQQAKIFRGQYLILQKRFDLERWGFVRKVAGQEQLVASAIAFRARGEPKRVVLGGLLFHPELQAEELRVFASKLLDATGPIAIAPQNGHMNLGLGLPEGDHDATKVTFLCASASEQTQTFFRQTRLFQPARELFAFSTRVTAELAHQVETSARDLKERGFDSRPISFMSFKRDMAIYNSLANESMAGHHGFEPLSFDEEWDLMRQGVLLYRASWFRFLTFRGREIGFSFAIPDYNQVLANSRGDIENAACVLASRLGRPMLRRARLVYSGIHPEFKGQGLFKAVRHRVIKEMIASGVEEFESSYIDEANRASLANVRSTGGRLSHRFHLFRTGDASLPTN